MGTHLSVIIPTLNEESYIGTLLESIKMQSFEDYEIIVSDSCSEDDTVKLTEQYGATILSGPQNGPGYARNRGAERASGDILLFLDADVVLPHEEVFDHLVTILDDDTVVAGTSSFRAADSRVLGQGLFFVASKVMEIVHKTGLESVAQGNFLFIRHNTFEEIGGFDEEMPYNEDHDLVRRASQTGEVVLLDERILVSARRIYARGVFGTIMDYGPPTLHYVLGDMEGLKKNYEFKTVNG